MVIKCQTSSVSGLLPVGLDQVLGDGVQRTRSKASTSVKNDELPGSSGVRPSVLSPQAQTLHVT
jgi:hypothetical protein